MTFPLNIAAFRAHFTPTFDNTPDALVQAKLDEAQVEINATIWDAHAEKGHAYLAAHLIAVDPGGRDARLAAKDGESIYGTEFTRLAKIVGGSYRVELE